MQRKPRSQLRPPRLPSRNPHGEQERFYHSALWWVSGSHVSRCVSSTTATPHSARSTNAYKKLVMSSASFLPAAHRKINPFWKLFEESLCGPVFSSTKYLPNAAEMQAWRLSTTAQFVSAISTFSPFGTALLMKLLFQRSTSHEPPKDKLGGSTELVLPRWRLHGG